jgi:hypothetical protein
VSVGLGNDHEDDAAEETEERPEGRDVFGNVVSGGPEAALLRRGFGGQAPRPVVSLPNP